MCKTAISEARTGGEFAALMRGGDVPLQLIEAIHNFADEDGNRIDPRYARPASGHSADVCNVGTFKTWTIARRDMSVAKYDYTSDQAFPLRAV